MPFGLTSVFMSVAITLDSGSPGFLHKVTNIYSADSVSGSKPDDIIDEYEVVVSP